MQRKRAVAAAISVAALASIPAIDAATRPFMQTKPTLLLAHGNSRRAVVFLTGAQSDAEVHSRQLRAFWQMYGDVIIVQYPRKRFSATEVVHAVYQKLQREEYDEFVIVAASFGARVGLDLIEHNNQQPKSLRVAGLIAADPVMDASDIVPAGANLARIWMPGALSNLGTRPFWMLFGDPLGECEPGADSHLVMEADTACLSWPLSGYRDQVRDIVGRKPLAPNAYEGLPAVILQSDDDRIVRPLAARKWVEALGGDVPVVGVRSGHVAFLHFPAAWQRAFNEAFTLLGISDY